MKKLLLIVFIAGAFTVSAQAQDSSATKKEHKGNHKKEWKGERKEKLDLSAEQREKVKAIHADFKARAKAIRDNQSLSEAQKKEEMKALAEKRREQMKGILTPEQQKKVAEQRKNLRKQHKREVRRK